MRITCVVLLLCLVACQRAGEPVALPTIPVGSGDTLVARDLAPDVAYREFVDRSGPLVMCTWCGWTCDAPNSNCATCARSTS